MKITPFITHFIAIVGLRGSDGVSMYLRDGQIRSEGSIPVGELSTKPVNGGFLSTYKGVTKHIGMKFGMPSRYDGIYTDPEWNRQWPLHDYRTSEGPVMDHNVVPVHRMNITGEGVHVAILSEGVFHSSHPDLQGHIVEEAKMKHKHGVYRGKAGLSSFIYEVDGTQVAGVVAMTANNSHCGVGVAFNADITSIKISSYSNNLEVAGAFTFRLYEKTNEVDIYISWLGTRHSGDVLHAMPALLSSIDYGASEGRHSKGAVYLTDVGNGKRLTRDNCAADALVNSVHMIGVAGASQWGKTVSYSERCPGIFAAAYTGDDKEDGILATEVGGGCSTEFKGTSAASAIAAGIIALVLEANPSLTNRDVQHLITMSAEVAPLADNPGTWYRNAAGFWVSNDFGFGLLNAENMVLNALKWENVPARTTCRVVFDMDDLMVNDRKTIYTTSQFTNACKYKKNKQVNVLESVELVLHVEHHTRGAIRLAVTSPEKTRTTVLETRPHDRTRKIFKGWRIKSLHNWGENPFGKWNVVVSLASYRKDSYDRLIDTIVRLTKMGRMGLRGVKLLLHGTTLPPAHYCNLPRTYSAFRLDDGRSSEDEHDKKMCPDRN